MITLTRITPFLPISSLTVLNSMSVFWHGRSVQRQLSSSQNFLPLFLDNKNKATSSKQQTNKQDEKLNAFPYPLPPGKPCEPPNYLRKEIDPFFNERYHRPKIEDDRTEEEKERDYNVVVKELKVSGLILTLEQAIKLYGPLPFEGVLTISKLKMLTECLTKETSGTNQKK